MLAHLLEKNAHIASGSAMWARKGSAYMQNAGRPSNSRNVRVIPEFHKEPDVEKLGRALIALVTRIAEMKQAEDVSLNNDDSGHKYKQSDLSEKEDSMA